MSKYNLIGSLISNEPYPILLERIIQQAQSHASEYVCLSNVHMLIESYRDSQFQAILNGASMALPDGKPVAVLMNWLYGSKQQRMAGPDLMLDLFQQANDRQLAIYFYGSTPEVLAAMQVKLRQEYPSLIIAGMHSPPFRPLSDAEMAADVDAICQSGAHLVMVGLGCPKQERWMAQNQEKIPAVMLGLGAAFPFYTGDLKRAPRWMQQSGLEWFYRLYKEPNRLFKRYLTTNVQFVCLASMQFFRIKCLNESESSCFK